MSPKAVTPKPKHQVLPLVILAIVAASFDPHLLGYIAAIGILAFILLLFLAPFLGALWLSKPK